MEIGKLNVEFEMHTTLGNIVEIMVPVEATSLNDSGLDGDVKLRLTRETAKQLAIFLQNAFKDQDDAVSRSFHEAV